MSKMLFILSRVHVARFNEVHGFLSDLGDHQLLISAARVFGRWFGFQFLGNI